MMMDRLKSMLVFCTVAEAESLTQAAKILREPLTTVSRQLAQLEAHVGTALIIRTNRHMTLTPAGRTYLEGCKQVLDDIDRLEAGAGRAKSSVSGELTLTAPVSFGRMHVLPLLDQYIRQNPDVHVRITFADHNLDLARQTVDIAFRIGALRDTRLVGSKVGSVSITTCASPAYLRQQGAPQAPSDLLRHACIAFSQLEAHARWAFKSRKRGRVQVRVSPVLEVNAAEAATDAARAGLGITRVLSYQAEPSLASGALQPVLTAYEDRLLPIHVLHQPTRHPRAVVKSFCAFAAKALRKSFA
jgi:DNA-binding transcriptional LysR family regulator